MFRLLVVAAAAACIGMILICRGIVLHAAKDAVFSDVESVPHRKVGLVLGCSKNLSNGYGNQFFINRITAASELYHAGKVDYLLVSGDNHIAGYDEPGEMKAALVQLKVPEDRVVCDYAGFRTLDSVVRANKVFLEEDFTVISQKFHNQRAIYIGRKHGLSLIGYNAADVSARWSFKTRCREQLARVKTVMDIHLLAKKPRFFGPTIVIGSAGNVD
jgi:SanA protein